MFQGQEMTLEAALSQTVRTVQRCLNDLERSLEQLAMLEEQQIDDEDFRRGVELEDSTCDLVEMLNELLSELPDIAADIRGPAPASQKSGIRSTSSGGRPPWSLKKRPSSRLRPRLKRPRR